MKDRIYGILVGRIPEIRDQYLRKKSQKPGNQLKNLIYALWLNLRYYLSCRQDHFPHNEIKKLYADGSESSLSLRESPEQFAKRLAQYDVISFDVFDTLIFRPFSHPTDVFFLVGMDLRYPHFKRLRIEAENTARQEKMKAFGTGEVTIEEIWRILERETGISRKIGVQTEWSWEKRCCFANPYMLKVVQELQKYGKRLIVISDMYLGQRRVQELLENCGYRAFESCYVSCDHMGSKGDGKLFGTVKKTIGSQNRWVHIGDHEIADIHQAERYGAKGYLYPNVNRTGSPYRPENLSAITGSFYCGLVNAHIHNGLKQYSREYEFGFIYGGLFAIGYCRFIHEYVLTHQIEKLLFLSRDGAVLLKTYLQLYPEESHRTAYAYWSRMAAVKLTAGYYKHEYLQRFLLHKANQGFSVHQVLESMEITDMSDSISKTAGAAPQDELTFEKAIRIKDYLLRVWDQVLKHYDVQAEAARDYYSALLKGCSKAAAVDIGWAGSGAIMLDHAVNRLWKLNCPIIGILAGTPGSQSPEPDDTESFFIRGQLVSYLFSQRKNRDLWKVHDPWKGYNLYWELLLGAPEGGLRGFYRNEKGEAVVQLRKSRTDPGRIEEIHRGILDFVQIFSETEKRLGLCFPISGRDAYGPMLSVCSRKNKDFMKGLEELLDEPHIG